MSTSYRSFASQRDALRATFFVHPAGSHCTFHPVFDFSVTMSHKFEGTAMNGHIVTIDRAENQMWPGPAATQRQHPPLRAPSECPPRGARRVGHYGVTNGGPRGHSVRKTSPRPGRAALFTSTCVRRLSAVLRHPLSALYPVKAPSPRRPAKGGSGPLCARAGRRGRGEGRGAFRGACARVVGGPHLGVLRAVREAKRCFGTGLARGWVSQLVPRRGAPCVL